MAAHYIKNPAKFLIDHGVLYYFNRVILVPLGFSISVEWPETEAEKAAAVESNGVVVHIIDLKKSEGFEGITEVDEEKEIALQQFCDTALRR